MASRPSLTILLVFLVGLIHGEDTALAAAEKRVALVVGIARYLAVPPLKSPINDASAVASKLQASGFSTTLVTDADQRTFRRVLASFERDTEGADVALVYYAGHAIQVDNQNYVLPSDANPESETDLASDGISLARVRRALGHARLRIVIADACRNNPFASRFPSQSRGTERGLAPEPPEASTLIAFSASPGQTADDGNTDHSPYAAALLKHMLTPGLELSVLLLRVSGEVRQATKNKQTPIITDDRDREFYFVSAPAAAPAGSSQSPMTRDQAVPEQASQSQFGSAADSGPSSERHLIVQDVIVVDQPGIGKNPIGRLRVGDIVVGLPYKSERWRAIQMANGRQGFVESAATRPVQ